MSNKVLGLPSLLCKSFRGTGERGWPPQGGTIAIVGKKEGSAVAP